MAGQDPDMVKAPAGSEHSVSRKIESEQTGLSSAAASAAASVSTEASKRGRSSKALGKMPALPSPPSSSPSPLPPPPFGPTLPLTAFNLHANQGEEERPTSPLPLAGPSSKAKGKMPVKLISRRPRPPSSSSDTDSPRLFDTDALTSRNLHVRNTYQKLDGQLRGTPSSRRLDPWLAGRRYDESDEDSPVSSPVPSGRWPNLPRSEATSIDVIVVWSGDDDE
jgi:hypothetical protein